jgi:plastocyanin
LISAGGAAIREYFVVRLKNPKRSMTAAVVGVALIAGVIVFSKEELGDINPVASETETESVYTPPPTIVGEEPAAAPAKVETSAVTAEISGAPGAAGVVSGVAVFEGTPPHGKKLNLPAACAKMIKGEAVSNEVLIKDGKIQNVLVRVVSGLEGKTFKDVPTEEITLDQRGCMYTPRVVGARVGQKVTFINSDSVFHNVRAVTTQNQKFNMAMPHKDQRETKVFNRPEIFLQAKCSVHPWMGAYVAVMEHPFFSVTNANGEFSIKNLPPGKYTIEAWHEVFGKQGIVVEVTDKGLPPLKFTFKELK